MFTKISIDSQEVDAWKQEAEALKREVAERQKRIAELEGDIEAATRLASRKQRQTDFALPEPPTRNINQVDHAPSTNMTDAMERVANSIPAPITKQELRNRLMDLGFEDKGPYLYTVIMRLKDRGKISVMSDGKIWRAPSHQ